MGFTVVFDISSFKVGFVEMLVKELEKLFCSRHAKKEQLRLWKGFTPAAAPEMSSKDKKFTGKVIEVGNADNLVVKTGDKTYQKIFFSSFRAPR